jgi:hypothetical protein
MSRAEPAMNAASATERCEPLTLFDWDAGDPAALEHYQWMVAHPRMGAAARALAVSSVETSYDPVMRDICKDAGRYVAGLGMIWLDLTGGLTLPRLKEVCARSRVLSPGRARSFLQLMHHAGHLQLVRASRAAAAGVYAPSAGFRAAWIEHLRGPVAAAALIAPEGRALLDRLDDPDVCATFVRLQGASLFETTANVGFAGPTVAAFYNPLAGVQVLSILIAGGDERSFPSRAPVPLPIAPTARRLGVSRVHLKRLLAHAVGAGLLVPHPGGGYALAEAADAELRFIYAAQLVSLLIAIGRTLRLHGLARASGAARSKMFNCDG